MMRNAAILLLLPMLGVAGLRAQGTGTLRLQVDPPDFSYRVDHGQALQQTGLDLLEGAHHFRFWAPERRAVDTVITISDGQAGLFRLRLPYSTEYLVYQRDLKAYKQDMRLQRLVPAVITAGGLMWTVAAWSGMKRAHDRLEEDRTAYDEAGSPHAITVLKEETMPMHQEEFREARDRTLVAAGATVVCAGITTWLWCRSAKRPAPAFIDKEKLRFDGLGWMPGPQGGSWQGGLSWNFGK